MHEAAFSQAALPRRARVLGTSLQDYCLIHELWLWRRENPFVTGVTATIETLRHALVEAVLICCHSPAELIGGNLDWKFWIASKLISRRANRLTEFDLALEQVEFANYRLEGSTEPPTLEPRSRPGPQTHSRTPGAPFVQRVEQFLIREFRLSEREALAYRYGLAKWHFCAHWESEDALRIKNANEERADNEIDSIKALMKSGLSLDAAFKKYREKPAMEGTCPV